MNNRFKFRVWNKEQQKLYSWDDLKKSKGDNSFYWCMLQAQNDEKNNILMQCTGLKDKNGTLIYEGDIVKCGKWDLAARDSFRDDEYIEQVGVINYYNNRCRFVVNRTTIVSSIEISLPETCLGILGDCHIEVIGNIYENKELLEDTECQK